MKLIVHAPSIDKNRIIATYSNGTSRYTHEFIAPQVIPHNEMMDRLAYWLALSHSVYLFSIEYFHEIVTDFPLSEEEKQFFEKIFYSGLAEFRYVNNIPIATRTRVQPLSVEPVRRISQPAETKGALLLNGGGKDGLTTGLLLKEAGLPFSLFQIGRGIAQQRTAEVLDTDSIEFIRHMEPRQFTGQYKGHRPTSANIAIAATFTALLMGKQDVIASNENSSNEPNLESEGVIINHQFTKTYEFEKEFSHLLTLFNIPVRYFSFMRPFHEIQIAQLLITYPEKSSSFISCNHGFRKGFWCGVCAKCAFVALLFGALMPEVNKALFGTTDIINKPEIVGHIEELVRPELAKPLECVGTLEESQAAAYLILKNKEISLSPELENLLRETSYHVTNKAIAALVSSFDIYHAIPNTYESALAIARLKLGIQ